MCVREREYVVCARECNGVRISTQKASVQSKEDSLCLHVNKELATAWSRDAFVDVHTHSNTQENLIRHRHVKRRKCLKHHFNSFENDGAKEFCCGRLVVQKCWSKPVCRCLCVFLYVFGMHVCHIQKMHKVYHVHSMYIYFWSIDVSIYRYTHTLALSLLHINTYTHTHLCWYSYRKSIHIHTYV